MSADIEVAGFCPQYAATYRVDGSKGKTYTVSFAVMQAHCDCPAYKYSGPYGDQDCKHVRAVWAHGCLYNPQWHDAGPNDLNANGIHIVSTDKGYGEPCPGCGGDMIPVRIAV